MKSCEILTFWNGISGLGPEMPFPDRKFHSKKLRFREILRNLNFSEWNFRSWTGNAIPRPEIPFPDRKFHSKKLKSHEILRNLNFSCNAILQCPSVRPSVVFNLVVISLLWLVESVFTRLSVVFKAYLSC